MWAKREKAVIDFMKPFIQGSRRDGWNPHFTMSEVIKLLTKQHIYQSFSISFISISLVIKYDKFSTMQFPEISREEKITIWQASDLRLVSR